MTLYCFENSWTGKKIRCYKIIVVFMMTSESEHIVKVYVCNHLKETISE